MDDAKWSQDRYNEIKSEVGKYLKGVGYKDADKVRFTPSSGLPAGEPLAKELA